MCGVLSRGSGKPLISIITPVYNGAAYLGETVDSVMRQTCADWEWFLIDDGSTDRSLEILDGIQDTRVRIVRCRHSVLPGVRNRGVELAQGEYLAFLDQDDRWHPAKLERQCAAFSASPGLLLVATNFRAFPSGRFKGYHMVRDERYSFRRLLKYNVIAASSVMIRKSVIGHVGMFTEDPELWGVGDYEYWLRILRFRDESALMLREKLVDYRVHSSSQSSACNFFRLRKILYERFADFDPEGVRAACASVEKGMLKFGFYNGTISLSDFIAAKELTPRKKVVVMLKRPLKRLLGRTGFTGPSVGPEPRNGFQRWWRSLLSRRRTPLG
jgi:glycosyltransferase involved in cell wall biosynthesis